MDAVPLCEPWPVSGCVSLDASIDPVVSGVGVMASSEILWAASGYRYGSCSTSFRPCSRRCDVESYGGWWWYPERWVNGWPYGPVAGGFLEVACGRCQGSCACTSAGELVLPRQAQAVTEVKIDGVVLPASGYILYDGLTLVRRDGKEWPFCQDWSAASGIGVFEVTATFGHPVPALGALAMGEMLPQVLKACAGKACRLPGGVVESVTRQGVSKRLAGAEKLAKGALTGMPLTNQFLQTTNPHGLMYGPKIWDPSALLDYRIET